MSWRGPIAQILKVGSTKCAGDFGKSAVPRFTKERPKLGGMTLPPGVPLPKVINNVCVGKS